LVNLLIADPDTPVCCPCCRAVVGVPAVTVLAEPALEKPAFNFSLVTGAAAASFLMGLGMIAGAVSWAANERATTAMDGRPQPTIAPATVPESTTMEAPLVSARPGPYSDERLRKQLLQVPTLQLDLDAERTTSQELVKVGTEPPQKRQMHFALAILDSRPDLTGLPLRKGADCQLGKEHADRLAYFSRRVRSLFNDRDLRNYNPEVLAGAVAKNLEVMNGAGRFSEAPVATLMQMLCVENQPVRHALLDHVAAIQHPSVSEALAKMALFDLSDKIRAEAAHGLTGRPTEEYQQALLAGLRYPWPPVADHAAAALVSLKDRSIVAELKKLAEAPDPRAAFYDEKRGGHFVRELVAINHLKNCLMCHAPSASKDDLVRGRIPPPDQPLPSGVEYYERQDGIFVRADVTYLRQDFSVFQPVDNADPWPTMQRFDYVVRVRPATAEEKAQPAARNYPQRQAVLYALKTLEEMPTE
jgi:hypothetical protein